MAKNSYDRRREKRGLGLTSSAWAVYEARQLGEYAATAHPSDPQRFRTNPFPPGHRSDAWRDGFVNADPMGDFMGRNY